VLRALAATSIPAAFTYARRGEEAAALAKELGQQCYQADFREPSCVPRLFDALAAEGPTPNLLIHVAGTATTEKLEAITPERWRETIDIHATSAFVACQELARRVAGPAEVVLTSGLAGVMPVPGPVHVAAAQGALQGMTRALARELGPRNIRVNLVILGALDGGASTALDAKSLADFKKYAALGRLGTANEATQAILWLALENTFMTGTALALSGGL
jgi:3-oxoacyl-[acyl-carrier protein] reductase